MSRPSSQRIGIIGAGIIGLAVARRLGEVEPKAEVTVLEKEGRVGVHQSGHNSGVVHAGVYYQPGSLKAKLCRRGVELLRPYCAQRSNAYDECGKLIVARNVDELGRLLEIERNAIANGVPGLRRMNLTQMTDIEPYVRGVAALHSPRTAIVDFRVVTRAYAEDVRDSGGKVSLGFEVAGIQRASRELRVRSAAGSELAFDRLIVCGGLHSDRLGQMAGEGREPEIVPFRGEFYTLIPERTKLVRGLIYPVPDPAYPFLGVHFTRRIDGGVEIGPNAVLAFKREGYSRTDFSVTDLCEALGSRGFRRLAGKHWRLGAAEMWGSVSKRAFVRRARDFIPTLSADDLRPAPAGVRAQALDPRRFTCGRLPDHPCRGTRASAQRPFSGCDLVTGHR